MNSAIRYIGVAASVLAISCIFTAQSARADAPATITPEQTSPIAEPYEPGSLVVQNEWRFTPGEKTTIATNFRSHAHHSGSSHCRNPHHHHSST